MNIRRPVLAAAVLLGSPVLADQIVELYGSSLTTYLYAGSTAVQGIRPRFSQRGVFVDGTMRQGSAFGWALAGDSLNGGGANSWDGNRSLASLDLATGSFAPTYVQMALRTRPPTPVSTPSTRPGRGPSSSRMPARRTATRTTPTGTRPTTGKTTHMSGMPSTA